MRRIIFHFLFLILLSGCMQQPLPTIEIKKDSQIGWGVKEPCTAVYVDDKDSIEVPAKIKCRGGFSSRFFKHSYALELDKKLPLGKLPKDDDWVLNASYIDKTFMRHKINYDLFNQFSPENKAPQCAYINLKVNGAYKGLYVLMEEMNAAMLELDKSDSLAMLFKDPPVFYQERLEYVQDSMNYYQQKFPKIGEKDQSAYLESFKAFLFESDDATFAREIYSWVEIESIIDWHILLLYSNNGDGIMKNFFLYKVDSETPFKIGIWDYDHSFGRDGDNELNWADKELHWRRSILLRRLVEIRETGYASDLKNRWNELRASGIISFENFKKHVDENRKKIDHEVGRNFELWPVTESWYFDKNTFEEEVALMLQFVKMHIPQLDAYVQNL